MEECKINPWVSRKQGGPGGPGVRIHLAVSFLPPRSLDTAAVQTNSNWVFVFSPDAPKVELECMTGQAGSTGLALAVGVWPHLVTLTGPGYWGEGEEWVEQSCSLHPCPRCGATPDAQTPLLALETFPKSSSPVHLCSAQGQCHSSNFSESFALGRTL